MSVAGDTIAMRPFEASLPMALLRSREAAMRLFRPLLAAHDLTEQQWRVLRALAANGAMEVGHIADETFLLGPSLTRILNNLETRSLIRRQTVAEDQRRSSISLTAQGTALFARVAPTSEETYRGIEAAFGVERLGALLIELDALRETMAGHDGD